MRLEPLTRAAVPHTEANVASDVVLGLPCQEESVGTETSHGLPAKSYELSRRSYERVPEPKHLTQQ